MMGCSSEESGSPNSSSGAAGGSTTGSGAGGGCTSEQYACGEQCCDCPQPGSISSQALSGPVSLAKGADLDGDGKMELVVAWQSGGVAALATNSCGVFELAGEIPAIEPTGLDVGSIDAAAGDDVITFEGSMTLAAWGGTDLHALWSGELAGLSSAGNVLAVHMDGDGDHDVAAFEPSNGKLLRVENTGSGWTVKVTVSLPPGIKRVAAGDLGGGPRDELLFLGGGLVEVVSVADFDFSDVRPLSSQQSFDAAFGDFNADGSPDAAIATMGGATLWQGDGATKLTSATVAMLPSQSAALAAHDRSGDGSPEIVALGVDGTLRILANTTLEAGEEMAAGTDAFTLAIGDVDGDGREDIVAVGAQGTLYIWRTP